MQFYRRTTRLIAHWRDGQLAVHPYLRGRAYATNLEVIKVLDFFSKWSTVDEFFQATVMGRRKGARPLLKKLVSAGLLEASKAPLAQKATVWDRWGDAAAFLHFSTRNRVFESALETRRRVAAGATATPAPAFTKTYPLRPRILLPKVSLKSRFDHVLQERRTWRQFGTAAPTLRDVGAVLGHTFGMQRLLNLGPYGHVMLRSSPSGGARHPTEAYVLVRSVSGVPPGAYYYSPTDHELVRISSKRFSQRDFTRLLAGQSWYRSASVLVCMASVFERTAWVYESPRAYKSLLLEAGHFCQTLCLAATARGLAPFCTGAFSATEIESYLGLDPVDESVMYVGGFGTRPPGKRWAPLSADEEIMARG